MGGADSAHIIYHGDGPLSRTDASLRAFGVHVPREKVEFGPISQGAEDEKDWLTPTKV